MWLQPTKGMGLSYIYSTFKIHLKSFWISFKCQVKIETHSKHIQIFLNDIRIAYQLDDKLVTFEMHSKYIHICIKNSFTFYFTRLCRCHIQLDPYTLSQLCLWFALPYFTTIFIDGSVLLPGPGGKEWNGKILTDFRLRKLFNKHDSIFISYYCRRLIFYDCRYIFPLEFTDTH